MYNLLTI